MNEKTKPMSRIPVSSPGPLRRTGSLRLGTCPPIQEHQADKKKIQSKLNRRHSLQSLSTATSFNNEKDDDTESVESFSSTTSLCSNLSQCDHSHFARNGTTYSGRCKKYVVHCSPHASETDDYLTPTQRTNRTIRRLRNLLKDAQADLVEKDKEILRLTKEIVELRLLKVDLAPETNGVDDNLAIKEDHVDSPIQTNQILSSPKPRYCSTPPLAPSLSDSGHFEEVNSCKDISNIIQAHSNQIKTIESIQRQYEDEIRELKEKQNDKVESLLQRITDVNDRYYALRPIYEESKEKINELEKIIAELQKNVCDKKKVYELEKLNVELLQQNKSLISELNEIKHKNEVMEVDKFTFDELLLENNELKNKHIQLLATINSEASKGCKNWNTVDPSVSDGTINLIDTDRLSCVVPTTCESSTSEVGNSELTTLPTEDVPDHEECVPESSLHKEEMGERRSVENIENSIVPELLNKLKIKQEELDNIESMYRRLLESRREETKHDPEMTLQFLKSAFYYFLTDRENAPGHLIAISSILGFTDTEKLNIEKAFLWR